VDDLAAFAGVTVSSKCTVRFPLIYLNTVREMINRRHMTGRLFIECSQGAEVCVTWEGSR
jgi:hypothetical protein